MNRLYCWAITYHLVVKPYPVVYDWLVLSCKVYIYLVFAITPCSTYFHIYGEVGGHIQTQRLEVYYYL